MAPPIARDLSDVPRHGHHVDLVIKERRHASVEPMDRLGTGLRWSTCKHARAGSTPTTSKSSLASMQANFVPDVNKKSTSPSHTTATE